MNAYDPVEVANELDLEYSHELAICHDALLRAASMIEDDFCSHVSSRGPHGADNEHCYTNFIYQALDSK